MAFGKRGTSQSNGSNKSTSARTASTSVKLAMAALILLGGGGAAYATRHQLAASFYPSLLSSMSASSEQLAATWQEDQGQPGEASSVVSWSACQMARACRDGAEIRRCDEERAFRQRMLPEMTLPQHRANLYHGAIGKAEDVVASAVKMPSFCEGAYFVARHDAIVANRKYLARAQAEATRLYNDRQRFIAALERARDKILTRSASPLDSDAEVANHCLSGGDSEKAFSCFMERVQGLNDGDRAADILRAAKRN